jgi:cellulose synthase/poly-beta-1,6-N-acetylglucosamine synthase-like glycosyltransferase
MSDPKPDPAFAEPAAASLPELSVVIPFYNESPNIPPLLAELRVDLSGTSGSGPR